MHTEISTDLHQKTEMQGQHMCALSKFLVPKNKDSTQCTRQTGWQRRKHTRTHRWCRQIGEHKRTDTATLNPPCCLVEPRHEGGKPPSSGARINTSLNRSNRRRLVEHTVHHLAQRVTALEQRVAPLPLLPPTTHYCSHYSRTDTDANTKQQSFPIVPAPASENLRVTGRHTNSYVWQ